MGSLPPLRHFIYVLGTVNLILGVVLVLLSLIFSAGVNLVTILFVVLVVNLISALTVVRQA
jgi:hypothetical protein